MWENNSSNKLTTHLPNTYFQHHVFLELWTYPLEYISEQSCVTRYKGCYLLSYPYSLSTINHDTSYNSLNNVHEFCFLCLSTFLLHFSTFLFSFIDCPILNVSHKFSFSILMSVNFLALLGLKLIERVNVNKLEDFYVFLVKCLKHYILIIIVIIIIFWANKLHAEVTL